VDVVGLAVEFDEFAFEVAAHIPHDLFHAHEVAFAQHPMSIFGDENQVACSTKMQCLPVRMEW
jgi:hypothetical protein